MVQRQGHVVARIMPVTKTIKTTTYRINMILEIGIKIDIVLLELKSMPKLSLKLLCRVFAASLQFLVVLHFGSLFFDTRNSLVDKKRLQQWSLFSRGERI
jgi:hypothetical protein